MVNVKVENIVASAKISGSLELAKVEEKLIGSTYNPDQFEGLLYKLLDPKAAFLLLKNGKAVCTGLRKMDDVKQAYINLAKLLKNEGFETTTPDNIEMDVKSIVASMDIAQKIDLETVVNVLEDDAEYDSKAFPGVIFHLSEPRATALIFESGKLVFTGAKSLEDLKAVVDIVLTRLEDGRAIVI